MIFNKTKKSKTANNFATWNTAGPNGFNPWEYYRGDQGIEYYNLFTNLQREIDSPSIHDVKLSQIFSETMVNTFFEKLQEKTLLDPKWVGLARTREIFSSLLDKNIISEILKDKTLGKKRLMSYPDRFSNTFTRDGKICHRPTVMNCYSKDMTCPENWISDWIEFFFGEVNASSRLKQLSKKKYPALTEEEEIISLPLQVMYLAVFDRIILYLVNSITNKKWHNLKRSLIEQFIRRKVPMTLDIVKKTYGHNHVLFLQEISEDFIECFSREDSRLKTVLPLRKNKRNQNSIILLNSDIFNLETVKHHTDKVLEYFKVDEIPCENGDLIVIEVRDNSDTSYILASYHGDTEGINTASILDAVDNFLKDYPKTKFIMGLDANSSSDGKGLDVIDFGRYLNDKSFMNCWSELDPLNNTTHNARTYLQPQLNKAVGIDDTKTKELKDYIIFRNVNSENTRKDNTGRHEFIDGIFPSKVFPSDHAIVSVKIF